jgi:hypothetical protein
MCNARTDGPFLAACLLFFSFFSQPAGPGDRQVPPGSLDQSPAALVQRQLDAYNQRDIETFLEPFSDDVEFYRYPNELLGKGKSKMREEYGALFARAVRLHCDLVNRIVLGTTVIDQERVTGVADRPIEAIVIYTIAGGKIMRVTVIY